MRTLERILHQIPVDLPPGQQVRGDFILGVLDEKIAAERQRRGLPLSKDPEGPIWARMTLDIEGTPYTITLEENKNHAHV